MAGRWLVRGWYLFGIVLLRGLLSGRYVALELRNSGQIKGNLFVQARRTKKLSSACGVRMMSSAATSGAGRFRH
eukprot:4061057-Pleurochrysis_carterae.AAC.1